MNIYINASAAVSPKSHPLPQAAGSNALKCADPDLSASVDPKLSRRMSHVIKMGLAASLQALKQAGIDKPDAIITGTAYGCLEDTGIFLKKQVTQNETMLTPTAFIQSTHNTVGGQIGLMLQCNAYNNTIVHRGFSFAQALQDAMMLLAEEEANYVLAGSSDEITDASHALLSRFDLYKTLLPDGSLSAGGAIAGEGAAYFVLTNQPSPNNIAILQAVHTFYKPASNQSIQKEITDFLSKHNTNAKSVDIVLIGKNGDKAADLQYEEVLFGLFDERRLVTFKEDCGDYPTATSYALHKAIVMLKDSETKKTILVYDHFQHIHHSLVLLSSC
jgi:3-oxoacyl-[acyl-carrier-protein] synthase II